MRYTTVPNWKTQLHGAVGFNEAGVGISGTESIFARDDALKLDPYNEETGITEDDIHDVVLPRAKTAREGIEILGSIVETIGAGEGFGVVFVDQKEVWYFETGTATSGWLTAPRRTRTSPPATRAVCSSTTPRAPTSWPQDSRELG